MQRQFKKVYMSNFVWFARILSWEFCSRPHEELLPRRLVAHQVAQKCQSTISKSGADGISQQGLQENSVMVATACSQLTRSLELQSLSDLGFSKRYVRCLQIADVVNSMKDLMNFFRDQKKGSIDGLKCFPRWVTGPKVQMQEMEQTGLLGSPADGNTLNKMMALGWSAQPALALTNYQNLLMRENSMNSTNRNLLQQEVSSPFSTSTSTSK